MQLILNEEQQELRRAARRFLDAQSSAERVMQVMPSERGYDPEVWQRIVEELGWTALTIPEQYDGIGMSYLDLHPLMEEMGRAVLCSPFFSTICLGANAILETGNEEQKQEWLPKIAMGECTATLAYTEKNGRWDATAVETIASRNDGEYRLNGRKYFVVDGHTADLLIVAARAEGSQGKEGISLFAVPADAAGVSRRWLPTMDQTRKQAEVILDDVRIPASALLGEEGGGGNALQRTVDLATTALAAEQVGGAEMCLDMAVEYAKVRKQFGRAIGSFQAIKHKCADMLLQVESARSASLYASALAAEQSDALGEAAASAKAYCSDAYFHCAAENIQIHGGIGFTWEHAAHLYFKRAKSSETLFGNAAFQRERVAVEMGL